MDIDLTRYQKRLVGDYYDHFIELRAEKLEEMADELEEVAEEFEEIHYTMKSEIDELNDLDWF